MERVSIGTVVVIKAEGRFGLKRNIKYRLLFLLPNIQRSPGSDIIGRWRRVRDVRWCQGQVSTSLMYLWYNSTKTDRSRPPFLMSPFEF
jgi:hypothetical protein